jgi:hypothetical protein
MKKIYFLFFLSFLVLFTFSCKKPSITPAYLILLTPETVSDSAYVDVSNFNKVHDTNYDQEELDIIKQHAITDVYLSINGHAQYWQLPCTVPVLPDYSRENNIRIIPCVRLANTTRTTTQYQFLKPIEQNMTLEKEGKYPIPSMKFEYRDEVTFSVLETFVQSTDFASIDTAHGVDLELYYDPTDKHMGKITLNASKPYFNIATPYFYLNGQGERHFWEIYYKSKDGTMVTYLNYRNTTTGATAMDMIIFPSTGGVWKKAYIELTDEISKACGTASRVSVRLGIRLVDAKTDNAEFCFKNVKVISMEARY